MWCWLREAKGGPGCPSGDGEADHIRAQQRTASTGLPALHNPVGSQRAKRHRGPVGYKAVASSTDAAPHSVME